MDIPSKGESKSISMSNVGSFVAIRKTGSNAPASAGGHDLCPAWPCAEDVQEEEEPHEGEVSRAEGNAQHNARTHLDIVFCYLGGGGQRHITHARYPTNGGGAAR